MDPNGIIPPRFTFFDTFKLVLRPLQGPIRFWLCENYGVTQSLLMAQASQMMFIASAIFAKVAHLNHTHPRFSSVPRVVTKIAIGLSVFTFTHAIFHFVDSNTEMNRTIRG